MANVIFLHKRVGEFHKNIDGSWSSSVHGRGGETVAMDAIPVWFSRDLKEGDFFEKRVGKSRCSMDDIFCKKTGRQFAESRLKLKKLTVTSVENSESEIKIYLRDSQKDTYLLVGYKNAKFLFLKDHWESLNSEF